MTVIGVLSDTHIQHLGDAAELAERLLAGPFAGVDLVLHAGDMVLPELLDLFAPVPAKGVRGNCDPAASDLPFKRVLQVEQCRIGLIHGWGPVEGLQQQVRQAFADQTIDALVYGHSHQPVCRWAGGLLCFNPGSALDRRKAPKHTVGLLRVDGATIAGELKSLPW